MPPNQPNADLSKVKAPPLAENAADIRLAEEEVAAFDEKKLELELKGLGQDIVARKTWGERVFWLLVAWLLGVFASVALEGFGWQHFHVSDSVLIALISTTTANVLALGYIVANYLFPKH